VEPNITLCYLKSKQQSGKQQQMTINTGKISQLAFTTAIAQNS